MKITHLPLTREELYYKMEFAEVGAEIGVLRGSNAKNILKAIPNLKLYLIDPWGSRNPKMENYPEMIGKRLVDYHVHICTGYSLDIVDAFDDGQLDFVYIDGDHRFDGVMMDLISWAPKVKPGGWIMGHDYHVTPKIEVVHALDVYTKNHSVKELFVTTEKYPTWYWVQPWT